MAQVTVMGGLPSMAADERSGSRRADGTLAAEGLTAGASARSTAVMSTYAEGLERLAAQAADRCTSCGKCFEVCPTAREAGLDAGTAHQRVSELLALTRTGGPAAQELQSWLNACDGSARCSDACPEEINVRQ